jgi:hypothetical protein
MEKMMTCGIRATEGPCLFCGKGKQFFQIKAETFSGCLCAAHLHSWLGQQEPQVIPNGQSVQHG